MSVDTKAWPVLKVYDREHLAKIALPLGGIGTGTVSLGGRGDLRDWELVNRPAKNFQPTAKGIYPFVALYVEDKDGDRKAKLLEGPEDECADYDEVGGGGPVLRNHGFPRFRDCEFHAAYPFGQAVLKDKTMPVDAVVMAFNPLIPGDADASGYPVAALRIKLTNKTDGPLKAAVCFSMPNFIGEDGRKEAASSCCGAAPVETARNVNAFKQSGALKGIFMTAPGVDQGAERWGDMSLSTDAAEQVSYRTDWAELSWGDNKLDFWDDFTEDGVLEERQGEKGKPVASLSVRKDLAPKATVEVLFLLSWRFPNRLPWQWEDKGVVGNYYAVQFPDSWAAAESFRAKLPELEAKTVDFVSSFCASDLPPEVKEAALFNLSTLRVQTCFRTPDGYFWGWEGACDCSGCCHGNCTHVWNYEQSTGFLFGDLAKGGRELEFLHATADNGLMSFRINLPLDHANDHGKAAADGQLGCFMKLYREWQLSGDDAWLAKLYPKAKLAMEFCWLPGGWDADQDGVMEGCQHNTMDVEYYGPNPQMAFWYLGALKSMAEIAAHLKDAAFAAKCRDLFSRGSAWIDKNLFNGDYYEHIVIPPKDSLILEGLNLNPKNDMADPALQLGAGCLVDQLVGQFFAHVLGFGPLSDPEKHRKTLRSILKYNFRSGFHDHFNHMRSYVMGDEEAVLMASYPKGRRPKRPFPYYNEVMTGFEHSLAVHLIYEGMVEEGLKVIRDVRSRYDGRKRSPFNEKECGNHYARAMAAWGAVLALTGFQWSGVEKSMRLGGGDGSHFWSNGFAWGVCSVKGAKVKLELKGGSLALGSFELAGLGRKSWTSVQELAAPAVLDFTVG